MDKQGKTKKRIKASKRLEQIVDAARTMFAKQGYKETTLDEVAGVVGVSRARVVQLVGSKKELYRAIVEQAYRDHPLDEDLKAPMDLDDDLGVLKAYAKHILDHYANPEDREVLTLLLYSRLREDVFSKKHFEEKDTLMINRLVYWHSARIAQGRFKQADAQVVVTAFQAMVVNLAIYKHVLGQLDFIDNEQLAEICADIFLHGLVRKS
jgi:AcrR family transcriptional regulator